MTSKDFIRAEENNTDRIVLYREGLFWKAYERSAFAVCSQIRPFKPTRRILKTLDGGDMVSIGFPSAVETKVLDGLVRLETEPDRLVLSAPRKIVEMEFQAWKASLPLTAPKRRPAAADSSEYSSPDICAASSEVGDAVVYDGDPAPQGRDPLTELPISTASANHDAAASTIRAIARRVDVFDLASSTPMECMMFLYELKKMLATSDDRGTI